MPRRAELAAPGEPAVVAGFHADGRASVYRGQRRRRPPRPRRSAHAGVPHRPGRDAPALPHAGGNAGGNWSADRSPERTALVRRDFGGRGTRRVPRRRPRRPAPARRGPGPPAGSRRSAPPGRTAGRTSPTSCGPACRRTARSPRGIKGSDERPRFETRPAPADPAGRRLRVPRPAGGRAVAGRRAPGRLPDPVRVRRRGVRRERVGAGRGGRDGPRLAGRRCRPRTWCCTPSGSIAPGSSKNPDHDRRAVAAGGGRERAGLAGRRGLAVHLHFHHRRLRADRRGNRQ